MKTKFRSLKLLQLNKYFLLLLCFIMLSTISFGQQVNVSGSIVDKDNLPLPGVTIVEKGTTNGTVTDMDGNYSISLRTKNPVIRFSSIGYFTQEIAADGQTSINLALLEDLELLDEVIVTGYGVQKKSDLTGAVSSVSSDKLNEMPATSLDQALQGRAAGVSITQNSGMPGGEVSIQIRGISSINGTAPLVIVDGVRGSLSNLNPGDIQSVEILKDASSSAIYGSSGGNGVILVTTRKGKEGKLLANFSHYTGWQTPWKKMDMMNSQELAGMMNYASALNGNEPFTAQPDTLANYDYQDIMFRTALMQNYDFSISGGNEKSTFFMSANYQEQEGIMRKSDYSRLGFRINSTHQINKIIKIGQNAQFTKTNNYGYEEWEYKDEYNTPLRSVLSMYPYIPPYDENGVWSENQAGGINPKVNEDILNKSRDSYSIRGNAYIDLNLFKGFVFTSKVNAYADFDINNNFQMIYHYNPTTLNERSRISKSIALQKGWEIQNYFNYNTTIASNHNIGLMAGFEAAKDDRSDMSGVRLDLINETKEMQFFDAGLDNSSPMQIVGGSGWEDARYAYFGRLNYDFKGKYLFTANVRKDYSSSFGPAFRSGTFPSFSAGWKFSEESFVQDLRFIDFGKLRFGYGETGANAPERYAYYARVNSTSGMLNYTFDQTINASQGATLQKMPNPEMHWETMIMSNLGIDLGFFDNKLTLTVDLFKKTNDGMLINQVLPASAGMYAAPNLVDIFGGNANPTTNIGKFENKGIEGTLGYKIIKGKFKAMFDMNAAVISNNVVNINGDSIYVGRNGVSLQNFCLTSEGFPVSQFNGFETDGLYSWDEVVYDSKNRPFVYRIDSEGDTIVQRRGIAPGDIKFVDQNGDGDITNDDKVNIGSPIPKFVFGFSTNLEYGNFDLNLFFDGKFGHKIFNGSKWWYMQQLLDGNAMSLMLDQYREPILDDDGQILFEGNTDTNVPRFAPSDPNQNFTKVSDFYVESGNYVRLKNLQLGYTFNNSQLSKFGLEKLRVYVGVKNLLTFTKYSGFDPEIASPNMLEQGNDKAGNYPHSKMYLLGVNIQF